MSDRARAMAAFERGDLEEGIEASEELLRQDLALGLRVDAARQLLTIGAARHMRRELEEARVWYRRAIAALEVLIGEGRIVLAPALASARVMLRSAQESPWRGDWRVARRLNDRLPAGPLDRLWVRTARACLLPTFPYWAHELWLERNAQRASDRADRAKDLVDWDQAMREARRALRLHLALVLLGRAESRREVARCLFNLGVGHARTKRHRESALWYDRAARALVTLAREGEGELRVWLAEALSGLARRQRALRRPAAALANLSAARAVLPATTRLHANICASRADLLEKMGRFEDAFEGWLESAELTQALIESGELDGADMFESVIEHALGSLRRLVPRELWIRCARRLVRILDRPAIAGRRGVPHVAAEALESLAAAFQGCGRLEEARRLHEQAIRISGGSNELAARAWRNLGLLYELAGDPERAIQAHREALAIVESRIRSGRLGELAGHARSSLRLFALLGRVGRSAEEIAAFAGRVFAILERLAPRRAELPPDARWAVLEILAEASRRGLRPDAVRSLAALHLDPAPGLDPIGDGG